MSAQKIQLLSVGLANLGLVMGLCAAWYWWRASRIPVVPKWGSIEPLDPAQALAGWVVAINEASSQSGRLNAIAAVLSGLAVVTSTFAGWLLTLQ